MRLDMPQGPKEYAVTVDGFPILQTAAVQASSSDLGEATLEQIARPFARGRAANVQPVLENLSALGIARPTEGGGGCGMS